jgi:hypothetical protein
MQKAQRIYHVSITPGPFLKAHLILRSALRHPETYENKLTEACASRIRLKTANKVLNRARLAIVVLVSVCKNDN